MMIKTVCILLGPYRNLTTLLASNLSLHPNCQVLNHAGRRIFQSDKINFFINYSDDKMNKFILRAIKYSQDTTAGWRGGTITSSHAYKKSQNLFPKAYINRFGHILVKKDIQCLFWKESMMVTNIIQNHNIDLSFLLENTSYLRFIYPIRNPLDCAHSNVEHAGSIARQIYNIEQYDMTHMLDFILKQLLWGAKLSKQHPKKIKLLFEQDMPKEITWERLAKFMQLKVDIKWISDVLRCGKIEAKHKHYNDSTIKCYKNKIELYFREDFPIIANKLLSFVDGK